MWSPDKTIHEQHSNAVREVLGISDAVQRHVRCLALIENATAMSELSDKRFRAWVMVMSQAAQDPSVFQPPAEKRSEVSPASSELPSPDVNDQEHFT